ncbi:MAG TPA: hypothetical protein VIT45_05885 [Allosphingosinicella sp.]
MAIRTDEVQKAFEATKAKAQELLGFAEDGYVSMGAIEFTHNGSNDFHLIGEDRAVPVTGFDVVVCNISPDTKGVLDLSTAMSAFPHESEHPRQVGIDPSTCRRIKVEAVYNLGVNSGIAPGQALGARGHRPWKGLIFFASRFAL